MKRRGVFATSLIMTYVVAAPLVAITPTEARWFVGLALAFVFTALARASVLYGRVKRPETRAIVGQSIATGFAAMAIVYAAPLVVPQAPSPDDPAFLAGMVAVGAAVGWLGAEYVLEPLLERLKKG
ncbi:MAG: hypothetical protein SFU83_14955 [Meiothermus sp.]|nr:hypothetical protein [Meiothermus sp.]